MSANLPYGIHWFRRDLRIEGHPALLKFCSGFQGRVIFVFNFDRVFLSRPDFSHNRFLFFLKTLENLKRQIEAQGGTLLFFDKKPEDGLDECITKLKSAGLGIPAAVQAGRDYEPFAKDRDERVSRYLKKTYGLELSFFRDHLLIEPEELSKPSSENEGYQVYTPFSKRWLEIFQTSTVNSRLREMNQALSQPLPRFTLQAPEHLVRSSHQILSEMITEVAARVSITLPAVGFQNAKAALKSFQENGIRLYDTARDFPSQSGTSKMSVYFKNGSFTTSHAICFLKLSPMNNDSVKYFKQIIWREFYYHILYRNPEIEHQAFQRNYNALKWENREDYFQAWKLGQTGYPIVDAGMRELSETGWMHNRVRMIVASFLTKDLLIDWKWGERYFMEKLLDGDLAPNNGGWQWAASTGCDAQPYFRIFNPTSQGEKFDPEGLYVRKYCPELASHPTKELHAPKASIVIHKEQREKALELYKFARSK